MFQSTHPHGVRPFARLISSVRIGFNPRTHTGCDRFQRGCCHGGRGFNPRTHTGCDVVYLLVCVLQGKFQSTHPHGVRQNSSGHSLYNPKFQSTHPHGVRRSFNLFITCFSWFQSTHPHGVRPCRSSPSAYTHVFQSTHPHGVRPEADCWGELSGLFQSTHPHGVRLPGYGRFLVPGCFNPRTHTGCDRLAVPRHRTTSVSIHAPTRGATAGFSFNPDTIIVSIHAPTRGATQL